MRSREERQRTSHVREVALVHSGHGEGIPGALLLCQRSHYTGEANESRRGHNPARMRHKSKEHHPSRALASPAMADHQGENSPYYLTVGKKPIEMTPIGS